RRAGGARLGRQSRAGGRPPAAGAGGRRGAEPAPRLTPSPRWEGTPPDAARAGFFVEGAGRWGLGRNGGRRAALEEPVRPARDDEPDHVGDVGTTEGTGHRTDEQ